MKHIKMLDERFGVGELRRELDDNPEVWNTIPLRTRFESSPHREVDDVWVRYNSLKNWHGDAAAFNSEHVSVWYPVVIALPSARLLAMELQCRLGAERMGAVLITRVPAGGQVYPHVDPGWHARYYEKFVIQVASSPGQKFCFEDGGLESEPGDCYWFDNQFPHWVVNPTDQDRISLIVCLRRDQCH